MVDVRGVKVEGVSERSHLPGHVTALASARYVPTFRQSRVATLHLLAFQSIFVLSTNIATLRRP